METFVHVFEWKSHPSIWAMGVYNTTKEGVTYETFGLNNRIISPVWHRIYSVYKVFYYQFDGFYWQRFTILKRSLELIRSKVSLIALTIRLGAVAKNMTCWTLVCYRNHVVRKKNALQIILHKQLFPLILKEQKLLANFQCGFEWYSRKSLDLHQNCTLHIFSGAHLRLSVDSLSRFLSVGLK